MKIRAITLSKKLSLLNAYIHNIWLGSGLIVIAIHTCVLYMIAFFSAPFVNIELQTPLAMQIALDAPVLHVSNDRARKVESTLQELSQTSRTAINNQSELMQHESVSYQNNAVASAVTGSQEQTQQTSLHNVSKPQLLTPTNVAGLSTNLVHHDADSKVSKHSQNNAKAQDTVQHNALTPPSFTAKYLNNPHPLYPEVSRAKGEQGLVQYRVWVSEDGKPLKIELYKSSQYVKLDQAAAKAILSWQFVPATQAGDPVKAWVVVPIHFTLKDS